MQPATSNDPSYPVLWLRSLAFWIMFPVTVIIAASLLVLSFPFSMERRWALLQVWVRFILWWL